MIINYVDIDNVIIDKSIISKHPRYFSKREIFSFVDPNDQKRKYCSSWLNWYFAKLLATKKTKYSSISHSGKYVIFVAYNNRVGVDIQATTEINYSLIAKRIFSKDEFVNEKELSSKEFYRLWCCKEALIKTLPKSIKYKIKDLKIYKKKNSYYSSFNNRKYYFKVGVLNKHMFAICTNKKLGIIQLNEINIK